MWFSAESNFEAARPTFSPSKTSTHMTLLTFHSDFHSRLLKKVFSGSRTRKTIVGWDFHNFHHSTTTSERENRRPEKVCYLRFPAAEKLHLWTTFHSGYQQKTVEIFSIIFPFPSFHQLLTSLLCRSTSVFMMAEAQSQNRRKINRRLWWTEHGALSSIHSFNMCVTEQSMKFSNEINVVP